MPTITLPNSIQNSDVSDADKLAGNFNAIVNEYNDTIGGLSGDVLTTNNIKTVENKTFVDIVGSVKSTNQIITTDTDGETITFDLFTSNVHQVTLGGNRTLAVTNAAVGQYFAIELIQSGTTSRIPTWFSTIKWVGGTAPTLTKTGGITVATLNAGGTGYVVNDVLTVSGGSTNSTFKITTVNDGVITGWTLVTAGDNYALGTAIAMTGGTGTGAKVNITGVTDSTGKKDTFMFRVTGAGTYDGYIVGMNI